MASSENSALTALSELRNMESSRQADQSAAETARQEAERRAREAEEARVRAEQERAEREEAERIAREQAEQEAKEREERIRVQEAEAKAKAEQDARLKEEQMRLDAQVKLHEKKQKPKWPYAVAGLAVVGLIIGGVTFKQHRDEAKAQAAADADRIAKEQQAAEKARKEAEAQAAENAKLLKEIEEMENKAKELEDKLANAKSEDERQKIIAEQEALKSKMSKARGKRRRGGGGGSSPSSQVAEPAKKDRKDKVKITQTDDPLGGL